MVHFVTTRNAQFFGFAPHDLGNNYPVFASDLERALIDGFARPDYCGGMVEVAKAVFMAKSRVNFDKLVGYAHRMKIAAIIRRMGFVLETLGLADEALVTKLKAGAAPGRSQIRPAIADGRNTQSKMGFTFECIRRGDPEGRWQLNDQTAEHFQACQSTVRRDP